MDIESTLPLDSDLSALPRARARTVVCYASSTDNPVAVADVFDALNSRRPYKEAWSSDEAFRELRKLADDKLDRDCVEARR